MLILSVGMGVYSNKQILRAVKNGHIVVRPFVRRHVAGSSVDVTLGEWYYRTERPSQGGFYNPFDENAVKRYFDGPHRAERHRDWARKHGRRLFANIGADQPIIMLRPQERILGHTHEFIGIKPPGTSTMHARSTWGRNGIAVCLDAGWGDPGYINRWTMEIYNMNQHESVVLPVGERVAQMVFHETGQVAGDYPALGGKYQSVFDDIQQLIANWQPQQMLPRAYKDKRRRPRRLQMECS